MKTEVSSPVALRVVEGERRPYLLVWNEGVLRSLSAASAMALGGGSLPAFSSGLLQLFAARVEQHFPELTLEVRRETGSVRIESRESERTSLALVGDLALDMDCRCSSRRAAFT